MVYRAVIEIDASGVATLSEEEIKHLIKVRRAQADSEFLGLCLDEETWYRCRLTRKDETWKVERLSSQPASCESPVRIQLACALLKKDKMEWVAQKACELGVTRIVPLLSEHVEPALAARFQKQQFRLEKILLESVKQCGRTRVPGLDPPARLDDFLSKHQADRVLVLDESGGQPVEDCLQDIQGGTPVSLTLVVGPEGGWSQCDREVFRSCGVEKVHLGARTMRAETASLAGIAIVQYLCGDLRP